MSIIIHLLIEAEVWPLTSLLWFDDGMDVDFRCTSRTIWASRWPVWRVWWSSSTLSQVQLFNTHRHRPERASRRSQHLQTLRLSGVDVFCQSSPETEPHGEQRHQLPSRRSVGNSLSSDVRLNLLVISSHRCAWFRRHQNGSFIKPHPLTSDERFHVFGGDGLNASLTWNFLNSSSCQFLAAKTRSRQDEVIPLVFSCRFSSFCCCETQNTNRWITSILTSVMWRSWTPAGERIKVLFSLSDDNPGSHAVTMVNMVKSFKHHQSNRRTLLYFYSSGLFCFTS